eukprot:201588_1
MSLVPFNRTNKSKVFFDIDKIGLLSGMAVAGAINKLTRTFFPLASLSSRFIVLKSTKYEKYHLYFPRLCITKELLQHVWQKTNRMLVAKQEAELFGCGTEEGMVDLSLASGKGCQLRIEGFNKYNREIQGYEEGTAYEIIYPQNQRFTVDFYEEIDLLIPSDAEVTQMSQPVARGVAVRQVEQEEDEDADAEEDADEEDVDIVSIEDGDEDDDVKQNIVLDDPLAETYPAAFRIIASYPVRSILERDDCIIFDFDKSEKGRDCKISDCIHRTNNCYLVMFKTNKKVFFKCHKCAEASLFVWKPTDFEEPGVVDDLIHTTDDAICRSFKSKFRSQWAVVPTQHGLSFIWFSGKYWQFDLDKLKIRSFISAEYQAAAQLDLLLLHENGKIDEKKYKECKYYLQKCLENSAKKTTIVNTLPEHITIRNIKLDADPFDWVFPGGVFNILDNHLRASEASEYVTNQQHVDWTFIPESELDPDIMESLESLLDHTLPDRDSQVAAATVMSTCLVGLVSRDFNYNWSKRGHSGKSMRTSLLEQLGGVGEEYSYGFRADKNCLRSRQDRATFALIDNKRFLLFEEIEESNPISADGIDRLTGCSRFTARHFQSAKASNVTKVTILINANTTNGIKPWKEATKDRCIMVPFPREYVKYQRDVCEEEGRFMRSTEYEGDEWRAKMVPYFFHYLCKYVRKWVIGGKIIPFSRRLSQLMNDTANDGSSFEAWITSLISNTTDGAVCLCDLKKEYMKTSYFNSLPVRDRRGDKYKMLLTEIDKIEDMKSCYKSQWRFDPNGANKKFNKVIVGWQWIQLKHSKIYSIDAKLANEEGQRSDEQNEAAAHIEEKQDQLTSDDEDNEDDDVLQEMQRLETRDSDFVMENEDGLVPSRVMRVLSQQMQEECHVRPDPHDDRPRKKRRMSV